VTVWQIALDPSRAPDADMLATLSDAERARADRFATAALRNRWLKAHVAMRRILADAIGTEPAAIAYGTGQYGKPFVAEPAGSGIEFNLSDSGDLALLAVSRGGPVGVDVEEFREPLDVDGVSRRFFAREEREALDSLPAVERVAAFYRIWTRKEAFIKAVGTGISLSLSGFAVSVGADAARLTRVDPGLGVRERFALASVESPPGYAAAVAQAKSPTVDLAVRDWDPSGAGLSVQVRRID
jgi:4'-phosphopantetheinyl transferase